MQLQITNCPYQLQEGTKSDESAYPIFKNDLYYDTFQRSFLAIIKAQGLYALILILMMVTIMNKKKLLEEEYCGGTDSFWKK